MANMAIASVLAHIVGVHEEGDNLPSGMSMPLEIVATGTHSGAGPGTLSGRTGSRVVSGGVQAGGDDRGRFESEVRAAWGRFDALPSEEAGVHGPAARS